MEKIIYRITLDTLRNGVQRVLQGFQTGDRYARSIDITLVSGSVSYELPLQNITAAMYVTVNGETSVNECTIDANKITYDIHNEDIATEGTVQMQLKLIETRAGGAERVLVSPNFALEVWQSDTDDDGAEGTPTFTALENALAQAAEYSNKTIAHIYIDEDNLFIVEYKDGTQYTSTVIQDALKDISNVRAWAERAEAAMVSAEASAAIASSSKDTTVASTATAVRAADSAAMSETNARTSERNAAESESNAFLYKESALTSASEAAASSSSASADAITASSAKDTAVSSASSASSSASTATAAASSASTDAATASTNAKLSQSYSVGGTSSRPGEDNDNAKYYKEQCEQIASSMQGGFIPMGTVTFANLPTDAAPGWMYNISDEFISDARFKDGGNKKYAAGTNAYVTADGMWDCLSGAIPMVNGKVGNSITLDGRDLLLDGYTKASAEESIAASDNIAAALGKLEKKADDNSANFTNYIPTSRIADYLTSSDTQKVLAASQGKKITALIDAKYEKPTDGIPKTDLASDVQATLDEVGIIATKTDDLEYLGWSVPDEFPIKNYKDADGVFHQRVGRVDMGTLGWSYLSGESRARATLSGYKKPANADTIPSAYCVKYDARTNTEVAQGSARGFALHHSSDFVFIYDSNYTGNASALKTSLNGVYLYYELTTEILHKRSLLTWKDANIQALTVTSNYSEINVPSLIGANEVVLIFAKGETPDIQIHLYNMGIGGHTYGTFHVINPTTSQYSYSIRARVYFSNGKVEVSDISASGMSATSTLNKIFYR